MTELLKQLIAIPRPSRGEDAGADFLEGHLRGLGLDVRRVKNNLWVESEPQSDKPTILLNAHLDTVKPASGYTRDPYTPSEEGDAVYGLGSNDCGGALVALLKVYLNLSA
ncbi:MAG: M20/M25/M40 family metallo-hydrolase, partial [Bacteroidales bacterium]|nr:M20/M25/M40 family metallo-hydrolase [Bacteroidales bacterium]